MSCPTCGHLLQRLSITTNGGGRFDVDHCGYCGGTWFDPYEINRIPYHEVIRLANLTVLPTMPPSTLPIQYCPKCRKRLEIFRMDSTPANADLLRCGKCKGIWASQKALDEFKHTQEDKIQVYKTSGRAFPSLSVVFAPALFILMLLFTTALTLTSLDNTKEGRIQAENNLKNIQAINLSSSAVVISFNTQSPAKTTIFYGLSSLEMQSKPISLAPDTVHSIVLNNLQADSVYIYQIKITDNNGKTYETEIKSFTTQKAEGK